MSATSYYSREHGRILTEKEAKNYVRWHKKGCASCRPVVVQTRPVPPPAPVPLTETAKAWPAHT